MTKSQEEFIEEEFIEEEFIEEEFIEEEFIEEEFLEEYRAQFEETDRALEAALEAMRILKTKTTVDGLKAAMNAAGYSDDESIEAYKMILWSRTVNERRRT
jgi:Xaa-Pro aminopeptidase